jgi:hypothetical protein
VEVVSILRSLWRRRLAVVAGAAVAVALGLMSTHPTPNTVVASTDVMLDTPVSSLSHASPPGADALLARATWLGNLTATDSSQQAIAHAAGLAPSAVSVLVAGADRPTLATPLARSATDSEAARPEPYRVVIRLNPTLPLISIDALAPRRSQALSLSDATVGALRTAAAPESRRVVVDDVSRPQTRVISGSSGRVRSLALSVTAFLLWCGLVVLWAALSSPSRQAVTATATNPAR